MFISCAKSSELVVLHQVTGPIDTNCYLLYDSLSKEAALIDIGGPIDELVAHVEENDLALKYIFATHVHMDHVEYVPHIKEQFPDALVGYNKEDYKNFFLIPDWTRENLPELYDMMVNSPDLRHYVDFDLSVFTEPDIYLEDGQTYMLGDLEIRTFLSPGHSAGSICFHVADILFSGDVLFHRQVGRTDILGGSKENIVKSVQRLYAELPDETKVYPGHGEFTDIGSEKIENEEVRIDTETVKN
jgi:glyoxylase-like metal-dependent hydrolase (beta-lactamase superfamily II)